MAIQLIEGSKKLYALTVGDKTVAHGTNIKQLWAICNERGENGKLTSPLVAWASRQPLVRKLDEAATKQFWADRTAQNAMKDAMATIAESAGAAGVELKLLKDQQDKALYRAFGDSVEVNALIESMGGVLADLKAYRDNRVAATFNVFLGDVEDIYAEYEDLAHQGEAHYD